VRYFTKECSAGIQAISRFFRISHQHSYSLPQVLQTPVNWLQWGQLTVLRAF